MSIKFDPQTLYSMEDLKALIEPVMTMQTFLTNIGLERTGQDRLYQDAIWGFEILEAVRKRCSQVNPSETKPASLPSLPVKRARSGNTKTHYIGANDIDRGRSGK